MRKYIYIALIPLIILFISSCGPKGYTPSQKRQFVLDMKEDALGKLYRVKPHTRKLIANAAGYGVFSNLNAQIFFVGGGKGYGVVVDNSTGDKTYMNMAEGALGFGLGIKDFREIILFNSPAVLYKFINFGWEVKLKGDAALKSGDKGGSLSTETDFQSDVVIYQVTETGVVLSANLGGAKYWRDKGLNY